MKNYYLVADIGGTNARLALVPSDKEKFEDLQTYACNTGASLEEVIATFLKPHSDKDIAAACLALPGPVEGGTFSFVNNDWIVNPQELEEKFATPIHLINDFSAQALALRGMHESDFDWVDQIRPNSNLVKALVGPGTGTGVGALMASGHVLPSEAGHMAFAPITSHQEKLLHFTRKKYGRVSVERFLSGPGLVNIYKFNQFQSGSATAESLQPSDITKEAEKGGALALQSIQDFWDILASFAGDIALAFGAKGGVYISGGAAQKLTPYLDKTRLRQIFSDKGRFSDLCADTPVAICLEAQMGLLGCQQLLQQKAPPIDS